MSRTIVMRATSLAASAGLLALLIAGALSVTYTLQHVDDGDPAPPIFVTPYEPPPPPPIPTHATPQPPTPNTVVTNDAPPTNVTGPPTPTFVDFGPSITGPITITDPHWLAIPANLSRYYPRGANAAQVEGSATLDCLVDASGRLYCHVVSETPSGWHFGDAALRIAADYRMAPAMRDGVAVEAHYRMQVPFEVPRR